MADLKLVFPPQILNKPVKKDLSAFILEAAAWGYSVETVPLQSELEEEVFFSGLGNSKGVIVAGGDGSINMVVNMLMERNELYPPLGVLPLGTANDFAGQLNKNHFSTQELLRSIDEERTVNVDIGLVNGRFFINVAAAGLFVDVSFNTGFLMKRNIGRLAYYLAGAGKLLRYEPFPLTIRFSDEDEEELEAYLFLVLNSRGVGGFRNMLPPASFADGLLDLVVIENKGGRLSLLSLLPRLSGGIPTKSPLVHHYQDTSFMIDSPVELTGTVDGEEGTSFPFCIGVLPGYLRFFTG